MEEFVRVAKAEQIPPGKMLPVRVEDEDVLIYNYEGTLYASRDQCTHQRYPLSKGIFRGKYIKCSLHFWEYDITTGEYQDNPGICMRRFPVKVEQGEVFVSLTPLEPPPRPFVSRDDA